MKKRCGNMERGILHGALSVMLVLSLLGSVGSDVASDRNECSSQLVGLSTCLPYAQGHANLPTKTCCDGLKQVVYKSRKCLCILIKDSKDPDLGLGINTTLAAKLPSSCSAPVNISACTDILHLAPNSPEAQLFKQLENSISTAPSVKGNSSMSSGVSSSGGSSSEKSSGVKSSGKRRWWGLGMACGLWIWYVASMLILDD